MHSDGIWNNLKLHKWFWRKDALTCIIVTHSETIFETAVRRNSTCFDLIKGAWSRLRPQILDFFENKERDWCIRMLFETIRGVNGAFCHYLIKCFDLQRNFESSKAKWGILTLFETFARRRRVCTPPPPGIR